MSDYVVYYSVCGHVKCGDPDAISVFDTLEEAIGFSQKYPMWCREPFRGEKKFFFSYVTIYRRELVFDKKDYVARLRCDKFQPKDSPDKIEFWGSEFDKETSLNQRFNYGYSGCELKELWSVMRRKGIEGKIYSFYRIRAW